jgi:hypothetical protein
MFLRVRSAREAGGSIFSARDVVLLNARNRSQRIANNNHAQAVVERCSRNLSRISSGLSEPRYTNEKKR